MLKFFYLNVEKHIEAGLANFNNRMINLKP